MYVWCYFIWQHVDAWYEYLFFVALYIKGALEWDSRFLHILIFIFDFHSWIPRLIKIALTTTSLFLIFRALYSEIRVWRTIDYSRVWNWPWFLKSEIRMQIKRLFLMSWVFPILHKKKYCLKFISQNIFKFHCNLVQASATICTIYFAACACHINEEIKFCMLQTLYVLQTLSIVFAMRVC